MEFHETLQQLRKQRGLTQEELAEKLYVSRTAISKWESGRGYPNIDSLKAISRFFSVTIDDLLSGEEVLTIAEEDQKQKESYFQSLVFGLLDLSVVMFLFLPLFGQTADGMIREVSLLSLSGIAPWMRAVYFAIVVGIVGTGVLTLAFQNIPGAVWGRCGRLLSILLNAAGVFLFIIGRQPYAAVFLFVFLAIKVFMLIKRQ
jgi:transcriptional regulator with XRE-family HTH domain